MLRVLYKNQGKKAKDIIGVYLLYGVVADILQKSDITPKDIKEMNLENVTDERIGKIRNIIYNEYKKQGGNSHVAKSSSFIDLVNNKLGL